MEEKETPKQEMIAQEEVAEDEPPPEDSPPDEPPPGEALGTAIAGDGPPDGFGLGGPGGNGGRGGLGTGAGGSGRKGNKYSYYANQVGLRIKEALAANRKTNRASFGPTNVRVWTDASGISRLKLARSTGNPATDKEIEEELTGMRLPIALPEGMPQPLVLRLSQQRPK